MKFLINALFLLAWMAAWGIVSRGDKWKGDE
jgi:hypothetical protein